MRARLAVYSAAGEPPIVEELGAPDAVSLVEALCDAVGDRSPLPAPAMREVIENLVHADFRDAVISVLDGGHTVRVSDHGPGIDDPGRALQAGFTTAGADDREIIRGVGSGLPLASAAMAELGGMLELAENLGGGLAVTLRIPPAGAAAAGMRRVAATPPPRFSSSSSWPPSPAIAAAASGRPLPTPRMISRSSASAVVKPAFNARPGSSMPGP